ncbi:TetR/AcrR family transcriptional regulator [Phenylobacterium sp.]|jgi:AcrR family transcriptional regulator|uniref:TetR/AcrR family transcriptional regulator n=1 Tax=Phenylobacterium sp. TaxID=1871053 RepID=UPI0037CCAAFD
MRTTKQLRSTVTRTRLIVAAIDLLAREGYAATTMARVAELADVSAGPRQYYFPTPLVLFEAVVDHIQEFQEAHSGQLETITDVREHLIQRFKSPFKVTGSPSHMAIIELRMACRGDPELRRAILSKIREFEERANARFLSFFEATKLTKNELLAIRGILVAASSGLATSGIEQTDPDAKKLVEDFLPIILADYIEKKSIYTAK